MPDTPGLSRREMLIIAFLIRRGGCATSEYVYDFVCRAMPTKKDCRGATKAAVIRLKKKGFVAKKRRPGDLKWMVCLTPSGIARIIQSLPDAGPEKEWETPL